jgi:hypothetical protein
MSKAPTPEMPSASPCGSGTQVSSHQSTRAHRANSYISPLICKQIIYAWALDAPKLQLPTDVGFQVGKDSNIQYLVLQVHYHLTSEKGDLRYYFKLRVLNNLIFL